MSRRPDRIEIPYNRPYVTGREAGYVAEAVNAGRLEANGPFAARCTGWLEERTGASRALLTHSCTGALEMAALLAGIEPGEEVIMPSFGHAATANVFVLRGALPVFVDVRPDTLSMAEDQLDAAVTSRTRAVVPVHYAGGASDMDTLLAVAQAHGLFVMEDAAQGILAAYKGRALGAIGNVGATSFHDTKNVTSGEGGALLINDPELVERAENIHEKGTNRRKFARGEVDEYTWVDLGSSYALSELGAACLWAQLEAADSITQRRLEIWNRYHEGLEQLEAHGRVRRPRFLEGSVPNGHIYYLLAEDRRERDRLIGRLRDEGIEAVFHFVPLHSSPAGRRFGRTAGDLTTTEDLAGRQVRLPLWPAMSNDQVDRVLHAVRRALA